MGKSELIEKVADKLLDMICEGGGDHTTLQQYATEIVELMLEQELIIENE